MGATWVFPGVSRELARLLPCAHISRNECWKVPPQTGGFPVSVAYSVGIHAVTDFSERQSAYHAASLEKSSCGVLQQPSFWLEMIEDIERSLNDCIGQREIPRRFGRGSGDGILRAGRRGPYEIVRDIYGTGGQIILESLGSPPRLLPEMMKNPMKVRYFLAWGCVHFSLVSF